MVMALISCPECNQQMSDTAGICPHCGYKLPKRISAKEKKSSLLISLLGALFIAFSFLRGFYAEINTHILNEKAMWTNKVWMRSLYNLADHGKGTAGVILFFIILLLIAGVAVMQLPKVYKKLPNSQMLTTAMSVVAAVIYIVVVMICVDYDYANGNIYKSFTVGEFLNLSYLFYVESALLFITVLMSVLKSCGITFKGKSENTIQIP